MILRSVFKISWTIKLETIFSDSRRQYANQILTLMLSLLYSPRKDILEQVNASEIFSLHCAVSEHLPALQAGIDMPKQPVNCILVEGCEENMNKMILIFFFTGGREPWNLCQYLNNKMIETYVAKEVESKGMLEQLVNCIFEGLKEFHCLF